MECENKQTNKLDEGK